MVPSPESLRSKKSFLPSSTFAAAGGLWGEGGARVYPLFFFFFFSVPSVAKRLFGNLLLLFCMSQLFINDFFVLLYRPVPDDPSPVDVESRRVIEVQVLGQLDVPVNFLLMFLRIYGFGEALNVQAELLSVFDEARPFELRRALDQEVVHLPVLALVPGRQGRLGRDAGIVTVAVGIIFDDEPYFARVGCEDFFDGRTGRHAVRSLEVEKFDDRDRGFLRSEGRRIAEGNVVILLLSRGGRDQSEEKEERCCQRSSRCVSGSADQGCFSHGWTISSSSLPSTSDISSGRSRPARCRRP